MANLNDPNDIAWSIDASLEMSESRTRLDRYVMRAMEGILANSAIDYAPKDLADVALKHAKASMGAVDKSVREEVERVGSQRPLKELDKNQNEISMPPWRSLQSEIEDVDGMLVYRATVECDDGTYQKEYKDRPDWPTVHEIEKDFIDNKDQWEKVNNDSPRHNFKTGERVKTCNDEIGYIAEIYKITIMVHDENGKDLGTFEPKELHPLPLKADQPPLSPEQIKTLGGIYRFLSGQSTAWNSYLERDFPEIFKTKNYCSKCIRTVAYIEIVNKGQGKPFAYHDICGRVLEEIDNGS